VEASLLFGAFAVLAVFGVVLVVVVALVADFLLLVLRLGSSSETNAPGIFGLPLDPSSSLPSSSSGSNSCSVSEGSVVGESASTLSSGWLPAALLLVSDNLYLFRGASLAAIEDAGLALDTEGA
jgi:hypothetical protein